MLETWNLVRKYTQYLVSENILFSTKTLLILLMSVFFCKIVLILKAFIVLFSFFERLKKTITENVSFADYSSIIQLPDCYKSTGNKKIDNDVTNFRLDVIVNFFRVVSCFLSSLFTGPSFMSIALLFLELWQFSFIRVWPEICKSETPLFEFCLISGDWGKLGTPNLAGMSLTKCYWMLQNTRVTTFIIY